MLCVELAVVLRFRRFLGGIGSCVNFKCVPYTHKLYLQECITSPQELIWKPSVELASSLGVRGRRFGEEVSG